MIWLALAWFVASVAFHRWYGPYDPVAEFRELRRRHREHFAGQLPRR